MVRENVRECGILMPVSSLSSRYGIGCFSKEIYDWIDFLEKGGQRLWQILPLGPVSYGDSPYQSFSTFAGNPLYISLEELIEDDLLTREECDLAGLEDADRGYVDYGLQFERRYQVLYLAYSRSNCGEDPEFAAFLKEHEAWIGEYALYMAVKESRGWKSWVEWEEDLRLRRPAAMEAVKEELADRIVFYEYLQYLFFTQWTKVRAYANEHDVRIIGDIPIYVALDSADVWMHPEQFVLDEDLMPTAVAGCSPDAFSATGQLWGNPLYDWDYMKKDGYSWWIRRISQCELLYDAVRIDHFRGFDEYYSIPAEDEDARNGHWETGPGIAFFRLIEEHLNGLEIIAEDLGFMTDTVRQLVADSGYPNMKVLQFAFGSDCNNEYLPYNYEKNCIVYTGTHDNETLMQHLEQAPDHERWYIAYFLGLDMAEPWKLCEELIRAAYACCAKYCIIPLQDFLYLGADARMNFPSTIGGINWRWRVFPERLDEGLAHRMRHLSGLYGRDGAFGRKEEPAVDEEIEEEEKTESES